MENFDRQYRFAASPAGGGSGFEVGSYSGTGLPIHIQFTVQRNDSEAENYSSIELWNLSPKNLAIVNEPGCLVELKAGYGANIATIFKGTVIFTSTDMSGGDRATTIECLDGLHYLRDTYVCLSYTGTINVKRIIGDVAAKMGITAQYSYNAVFSNISNGYSYVGAAGDALDALCSASNLSWSIQNGILQVKRPGDVMKLSAYQLSADTGLIGVPKRVSITGDYLNDTVQYGYDVDYLLNGAINIDDYVMLQSTLASGYFRVETLSMQGDNYGGNWQSTARLLEVTT